MTRWIPDAESKDTALLLAEAIQICFTGDRVQFLVSPGLGAAVVQRLRVALSRSRNRNRSKGRPVAEFSLHHDIYPYTKDSKRHDCVVLWTQKQRHHVIRELLDDTLRSE